MTLARAAISAGKATEPAQKGQAERSGRMKILVIGLGVIGTTYGYLFQKAGHRVEHLIRDGKKSTAPDRMEIELLDGRSDDHGEKKADVYPVSLADGGSYDFILVSVSAGKLEGAVKALEKNGIKGTLLLMSGIWEDRQWLDAVLNGWDFVLGYPVAGGSRSGGRLTCCVFDHIMLESREKTNIRNYRQLLTLLSDCRLKAETPFDMLEWIWLHMAINAGVITTAGKYGDVRNTAEAAENAMGSPRILSEAVRAIRETSKIVASRGVALKNYRNELLPYRIPSKLAGVMMKRMFRNNELTRRIMTLHSNIGDLLYVCKNVYGCGRRNHVEAPLFDSNYEAVRKQLGIAGALRADQRRSAGD